MKTAPFQMHHVNSQKEVLSLLDQYGEDARILAGGQTLLPVLAMRIASPEHLIDINQVDELKYFGKKENFLVVGAGVRQSELEAWSELPKVQPLLQMMFPWVAHSPIRNRGTVCGSIAHADPSAEMVLALCVLGGVVVLMTKQGSRTVPAQEFFVGALQTVRQPNELITEVQFPIFDQTATFGFAEYGYRHGDFAVVAVAVCKVKNKWSIGFGGINDCVVVHHFDASTLEEASNKVQTLATSLEVRQDPSATSGLRRHLMRTLGHQACRQAIQTDKEDKR